MRLGSSTVRQGPPRVQQLRISAGCDRGAPVTLGVIELPHTLAAQIQGGASDAETRVHREFVCICVTEASQQNRLVRRTKEIFTMSMERNRANCRRAVLASRPKLFLCGGHCFSPVSRIFGTSLTVMPSRQS